MIWPMAFGEWTCPCGKPVPWRDAVVTRRGQVLIGVRHANCPERQE